MKKYLWMAVDADEYELPIAVAETAKELGEMLGISDSTVVNCEMRGWNGRVSGRRFVKVRNTDEL